MLPASSARKLLAARRGRGWVSVFSKPEPETTRWNLYCFPPTEFLTACS